MRSGLSWKAASQISGLISRTATTVVLAHLLAPHDFGLAGMVLVFSGLILLVSDLGFSASLIQFERLTEEDRSTAFWTGVFVGVAAVVVAFIVAPYVADFYGEPRVRWMFVAISTGFLTGSLSTTQASLLWRKMDFRALEIRSIVAGLVSAAVGVAAAFAGLGAWSLILQSVSMGVISTVAIWTVSPWKPRLLFSTASLRRMGAFSSNVFVARLLQYADRNGDNLLVARFLGPTALGIYGIGYSVIVVPFERLVGPLSNVLIPAFASLQTDIPRMRALWLRGQRLTATVIFPAMVGIIIVCPDFVRVVLGTRWLPATHVIEILAWVTLIQSLSFTTGAIYQARSRSGTLLRVTMLAAGVDLTGFAIGLHWGVVGVATAYAITNTVVLVPTNLFMISRLLEISPATFVKELRGVIEATLVMGGTIIGLRRALIAWGLGSTLRLVILIVAGVLVYLLMCAWRERRVWSEIRRGLAGFWVRGVGARLGSGTHE